MPTASYLTTEKYLCTQKNGSWNPRGERKITADEHQRARKVVPSTTQRLTEQETIRQSIIERQPHQPHPTVPWPPSSGTSINEFNTEGCISCAFPTFFPSGAADFVAPRPNVVTIGNYFKHLLMYELFWYNMQVRCKRLHNRSMLFSAVV